MSRNRKVGFQAKRALMCGYAAVNDADLVRHLLICRHANCQQQAARLRAHLAQAAGVSKAAGFGGPRNG